MNLSYFEKECEILNDIVLKGTDYVLVQPNHNYSMNFKIVSLELGVAKVVSFDYTRPYDSRTLSVSNYALKLSPELHFIAEHSKYLSKCTDSLLDEDLCAFMANHRIKIKPYDKFPYSGIVTERKLRKRLSFHPIFLWFCIKGFLRYLQDLVMD